jgi:hypothetical protein
MFNLMAVYWILMEMSEGAAFELTSGIIEGFSATWTSAAA